MIKSDILNRPAVQWIPLRAPLCTISLHAYEIQCRLNTTATRITATALFSVKSDSFTTLVHTCLINMKESVNHQICSAPDGTENVYSQQELGGSGALSAVLDSTHCNYESQIKPRVPSSV